jgi:hypothetical protein
MFKLPEDGATIDAVQKSVKLIRLIGKTAVVNEYVRCVDSTCSYRLCRLAKQAVSLVWRVVVQQGKLSKMMP